MLQPPHASSRPIVLFIGGFGRSGSTLLERLLGELPGVATLGEVVHLWSRGVRDDELCACGAPFGDCAFWTPVGDRAFGGWSRADGERMIELRSRVDRLRHTPRLTRPGTGSFAADLREYVDRYERVLAASAAVSGAQVVVDSSKHASTALALTHAPHLDVRVLQIVRDPRGVAHSWAKEVSRPETGGTRLMPQYSAGRSTALWVAHNLAVRGAARHGRPFALVRYEDLVRDPAGVVDAAWHRLGLPGTAHLTVRPASSVTLGPSHSVAGNPMRFVTGPVTVSADEAWRRDMPRSQRRIATAVGLPLMGRLGYLRPPA